MNERQENKLGVMPIAKLLAVMSVPMMISMFIQALYNVVDSMFVAKMSEKALAAVSIAYPMQNVIIAIGVGTGVGIMALVPKSLGRGDRETANRAANVQLFLAFCYSIIFVFAGLFLSEKFYRVQTNDPEIVENGVQYLRIVCVFSIGAFFAQNLEKLLVSRGSSTMSMISQAAGAVLNIILDPLLIFGIGPFPALGVTGAAVATVLGQVFAAVLAFSFNLRLKDEIHFSFRHILPSVKVVKAIYAVGIPSMLTVGLSSAMTYSINQIFLAIGTTATAAFGIWIKLQSFGFMPVFGMNNGSIAILSYNYGAKKMDRVKKTLSLAMKVGISVSALVMVLYMIFAHGLLSLFSATENMYAIGMRAIRICSISMPFGACTVIFSSAFQSLGRSRYTLLINSCRQLLVLVPTAWLLSLLGDIGVIWFAFPIAEMITMVLAAIIGIRLIKSLSRNH